jgi:putative membrane protein
VPTILLYRVFSKPIPEIGDGVANVQAYPLSCGATQPIVRPMPMVSYHSLAPLNSILNSIAAILLLCGFIFIRKGRVRAHRFCMISAVVVSTAFFISYLIYHYHVGDVHFQGHGLIRPAYFAILITHITLAVVILPLVVTTVWRALSGRFASHRRIAVVTWPLWMYVSVTGVIVYLMCYQLYAPGYQNAVTATAIASTARGKPKP